MKKIMALLLALVLCMGLTVPAFAVEYAPYICNYQSISMEDGSHFDDALTFEAAYAESVTLADGRSATVVTVKPGTTVSHQYGSIGYYSSSDLTLDKNGVWSLSYTDGFEGSANGSIESVLYGRTEIILLDTVDPVIVRIGDANIGSAEEPTTSNNPFTDVPADAYYHDAVLWALEKGITTGTSATTFAPTATCTRSQVATFLWRAKGCPEPATEVNPFTDVKESDYFYKAVLWAYENGITTGTSATAFTPDATCTSGQVITFLWRANGKPAAVTTGTEYYAEAVAWGNANELMAGTDTPFAPDDLSPRADIVTYLYRDLAE